MTDLVTIGITCYNAADSICAAIDSARAQRWDHIEIIIVDDKSTDNSVDVVRTHIANDLSCRLIEHPVNQGVAAARNTLIAAAKGEFIVFFDDDDTSHPDRIRLQHDRILVHERQTGARLVTCHATVRRHYANDYNLSLPAIGSRPKIPHGQDIVNYHLYLDRDPSVFYGSGTPCLSFMARKSVLVEVGGFDINLRRNEDGEFAIRLGLAGGDIVGCAEELVFQTSTTGADKRPEFSLQSDLYIIEKYRDILRQAGRYTYARCWAHIKYCHHAGKHFEGMCWLLLLTIRHPVLTTARFMKRVPARLIHEWRVKMRRGRSLGKS